MMNPEFRDDPVITYLLACLRSRDQRIAYLPAYFTALFTAAGLNQALFYEVEDWSCCGVLVPPGCRVDNPWTYFQAGMVGVVWKIGWEGVSKMIVEYSGMADAAKKRALRDQKYFYLFIIGTKLDCRGRGLSSDLIRYFQAIAEKDQLPLWLEATTPYSAKLYEKLGFETVEEIVMGKGTTAPDGTECEDGEGVKLWAMIWRAPPATGKKSLDTGKA